MVRWPCLRSTVSSSVTPLESLGSGSSLGAAALSRGSRANVSEEEIVMRGRGDERGILVQRCRRVLSILGRVSSLKVVDLKTNTLLPQSHL